MRKILGIELGSTIIKSILIDESGKTLASGGFVWENELVDGLWSYSLDKAIEGVASSYAELKKNFEETYKEKLTTIDAIGISAMMHGFIALDKEDRLLAPFRTWRNTNTKEASDELSSLFKFNVPMRWSVSQYYQSILENAPYMKNINYLTTLAGYIHYLLTGEKVLGIDDASGMFPVDEKSYHPEMMNKFNNLLKGKGIEVNFETLLPKVLLAGDNAGSLTEKGALLLDKSGDLKPGSIFCPPEGDMATGVICTNCVKPGFGNVSNGTSSNLTVVLDKPLKNYYKEIDVVSTPDGHHCALIHTNNCTNEINAWVSLFNEVIELSGGSIEKGDLYTKLFKKSLESDSDVGNLVAYNFLSGEPIAQTFSGFPMIGRPSSSKLDLSNFMQAMIYSAIGVLRLGMNILKEEGVHVSNVLGHGGFFKTPFVGQNATSAILGVPVTCMSTASQGGAWGIAILALYTLDHSKPLNDFLDLIFSDVEKTTVTASDEDIKKANKFMSNYTMYLDVERKGSEKQ